MIKIYETKTAPNPRRVRMFMAEKGLLDVAEFVQIDLQKGENLTPEFAARNPFKKVPVMELDDGTAVAETMAICRYLRKATLIRLHYWVTRRWKKHGLNSGCAG